nr:M20 family metallopeptidase [Mesorhizobium loti]
MLSAAEQRVIEWIRAHQSEMVELLQRLVNQDSPSNVKAETDRAGAILEDFLKNNGIVTERLEHENLGFMLRGHTGKTEDRHCLLLAHRDTVFPSGEAAARPFHQTKDHAFGPGVADMKAGAVMNAFVLAAFKQTGCDHHLVGLFSSDEEIGSPFSRALITREADGARCVLNSEPGRMSGNVVTKRKGGRFMRLDVLGRPAHSGADITKGASAIEELAHKIVELHALTDHGTGVTVNVGLVSGGISVNTSAPSATGRIDLRFPDDGLGGQAMDAIQAIVDKATVSGTSASLAIEGEFLPMYQNAQTLGLFDTYRAAAASLGFSVGHEPTGACSESGFAQSTGAATLCAVGPVGGRAHTPDEYIEVSTIVPRASAAALTLLRYRGS